MDIKEYIKRGFNCPNCESKKLRTCHHDHQTLDSWICKSCGLRWHEDVGNDEEPKTLEKLDKYVEKILNQKRVFWVLHKRGSLLPIMDSRSEDEVDFKSFGNMHVEKSIADHFAKKVEHKRAILIDAETTDDYIENLKDEIDEFDEDERQDYIVKIIGIEDGTMVTMKGNKELYKKFKPNEE